MKALRYVFLIAAAMAITPVVSQTKPAPAKPAAAAPADNMPILRDKLKGDKKLLVAANMDLTEAEAKKFWPLYEEYQKELAKINDQMATTITAYAKEYNAGSLTDKKAIELINQSIATEESESRAKRAFIPKLSKVLPGRKVARYMQVENKIRALIKYEIAGEVPLAP